MKNTIRIRIYHILVNKQPGIRQRYHERHDCAAGAAKVGSWIYLLWLNFQYYILRCRKIGDAVEVKIYEEAPLLLNESESMREGWECPGVDEFVRACMDYDVISFDLFDTLLFRPFSEPTDLFYLMGDRLGLLDFKRMRIRAEAAAREGGKGKGSNCREVTLKEIWFQLAQDVGADAREGMRLEMELEQRLCYANPFMGRVWERLAQSGKTMIVVSDMYLPGAFLRELLHRNGFVGESALYVSCEYGASKAAGNLYERVKEDYRDKRLIQIGDNAVSDVQRAREHGFAVLPYFNCDWKGASFRARDMSPIVGGAYRGIVNHVLYNGTEHFSQAEEFGLIYGGLFVVGYCSFIHEYACAHGIGRILFLSRDGDILRRAYEKLYPSEEARYVYWSRAAAVKLMADYDRQDFFRRFLYHKANQGKTIGCALREMGLGCLEAEFEKELGINDSCSRFFHRTLTDKSATELEVFLREHWKMVLEQYAPEQEAAARYYNLQLADCEKALVVDIGWAGSGFASLRYLVERVWNIPCRLTGMVAGTNTVHNAEADASESFLQSGSLVAYLYSQSHNRDLLKKHDPSKDYNVYWELLLSSPTKQFLGFRMQDGETVPVFGKEDANQSGIREIQSGILRFVEEYRKRFEGFPEMRRISGRDAYAPMLLAAGHHEAYLKQIAAMFSLEVSVNCDLSS